MKETVLKELDGAGRDTYGILRDAPAALKADREVVLAAVANNGLALQFAAADVQADREIVLASVANDGYALLFAADALRMDREVVLAVVATDGGALQFAADALRADREVVGQAVATDADALQYADEALRSDDTVKSLAAGRDDAPADETRATFARRRGLADEALVPGTRLRIATHGDGAYERFERRQLGCNVHYVRFDDGVVQKVELKKLQPVQWSVLAPPGDTDSATAEEGVPPDMEPEPEPPESASRAKEAACAEECPTFRACRQFVESFGLPEGTFDASSNICFCSKYGCAARHPDTQTRGRRPYGFPKGWCGLGLMISSEEFKRRRIWEDWDVEMRRTQRWRF